MLTIVSILGIIFGALITIKADWLYNFFGQVDWAEEHLGAEGGSRLFYRLFGIAVIVFSLLLMSGLLESIVLVIFRPIIPR